jgi:hypothetical protein
MEKFFPGCWACQKFYPQQQTLMMGIETVPELSAQDFINFSRHESFISGELTAAICIETNYIKFHRFAFYFVHIKFYKRNEMSTYELNSRSNT